jgi:hypothetical protein
LVTPAQLAKAREEQARTPSKLLGEILREDGVLTPAAVRAALDHQKRLRSTRSAQALADEVEDRLAAWASGIG